MKYSVRKLTLCLALALGALPVHAGDFTPQQTVDHQGQAYHLANTWKAGQGQIHYEYTTGGDTMAQWHTLLTISALTVPDMKAGQWAAGFKAQLDKMKPVPSYHVAYKDDWAEILVIYPPDDRYPTYEANVQRAVWSPSCQAVMVYAFAEHFPASNSEKEVLAGLRSREKEVMAQPWAPTCQP